MLNSDNILSLLTRKLCSRRDLLLFHVWAKHFMIPLFKFPLFSLEVIPKPINLKFQAGLLGKIFVSANVFLST